MTTIEIYYDEQDPQNPGWAYRDTAEGSPAGSGARPDDCASWCEAVDRRAAHDDGPIRAAWMPIRAACARMGIDPGDICFVDRQGGRVGNPWPEISAWREYGGIFDEDDEGDGEND
jgi:hypothetical protein